MSKRLFGIISDKTGIPSALIVNNLNRSQSAQIAESRDKNGKVIQQQAYSIQKSVNLNGITTAADPIDAGKQITIAGENYLVDQTAQNEANTAFVDVSISAVHSDKADIIQIGEILPESGNQTISLSFITAGADHILSGHIGADKDGNPIEGQIMTVTPSLDGNKFSIEKGYVAAPTELTVPAAQIIETDKKVTIGVGYLGESKEYELASEASDIDLTFVTAGTNQILSGFTGSDKDGNPVQGSIETVYPELSDSGDIKIHIDSGYLEDSFDFNVKEGKIEVEQNRVILRGGYYSTNMITVGELYLDTEITPGTEDQIISANSFLPQDLIIRGVNASGAFNIVKVEEYSPYVPAYPDIYGVNVYFTKKNLWGDYGTLVDGTDPAEYIDQQFQGIYTPTEETMNCTGFGRVFRNENGMEIRGYDNDTYGPGTEETINGIWLIVNGSYYYEWMTNMDAELYSDAVKNPWDAVTWGSQTNGEAGTVDIRRTEEPVKAATAEIPMILKGSVTAGYDPSTSEWTDGTSSRNYTGFETEPILHWYYASTSDKLIGAPINSNVPYVFYASLDESYSRTHAETGEEFILTNTKLTMPTIDGVPCLSSEVVNTADVSVNIPEGVFVTGKPFAVSLFMREEQGGYDLAAFEIREPSDNLILKVGLDSGCYVGVWGTTSYGSPKSYKGKWVHVFLVNHGNREELYVNGTLAASKEITRNLSNHKTTMMFGDYRYIGTVSYVAQVKCYNYIVSPLQVKAEADRCLAMVQQGVQ